MMQFMFRVLFVRIACLLLVNLDLSTGCNEDEFVHETLVVSEIEPDETVIQARYV